MGNGHSIETHLPDGWGHNHLRNVFNRRHLSLPPFSCVCLGILDCHNQPDRVCVATVIVRACYVKNRALPPFETAWNFLGSFSAGEQEGVGCRRAFLRGPAESRRPGEARVGSRETPKPTVSAHGFRLSFRKTIERERIEVFAQTAAETATELKF